MAYDQVGTLRALINSAGEIVKRIDYDSFGNVLHETLPEFFIPQGFASGMTDRFVLYLRKVRSSLQKRYHSFFVVLFLFLYPCAILLHRSNEVKFATNWSLYLKMSHRLEEVSSVPLNPFSMNFVTFWKCQGRHHQGRMFQITPTPLKKLTFVHPETGRKLSGRIDLHKQGYFIWESKHLGGFTQSSSAGHVQAHLDKTIILSQFE